MRALVFLFLCFVVAWDLVASGPENAAVTRASKAAYAWAREQIERHDIDDLVRRLGGALDRFGAEVDGLAEDWRAARLQQVAALPPLDPIAAAPLPDVSALAAVIPTPAPTALASEVSSGSRSDSGPAALTVGDSVFAKESILAFIAEASARTGVSAAYLEALALRESSFNPVAASDSSSARGLYQFIESTWLEVFARHGALHEQDELAQLIAVSADGRPDVSNDRMRDRILDLRFDPKLSTFLAARLAADNRAGLEAALGRAVSDAELYIAHFLGLAGAETLIETKAARPQSDASALFPWAARSNRSYFYDGRRHRSVAELYEALLLQAGDLDAVASTDGRLRTAGL